MEIKGFRLQLERTIRLLIPWPIEGLHMHGWIVQKDVKTAAALVTAGLAEYVPTGTLPHPEQLQWAREVQAHLDKEG